ncbi:UDP-4-amino-4,6-dideoxy-N-acetyl-beta-L-altrosamine transaminase [Thiomicrorhabdus lithotrophica]|uniref:UDP-4-amino-4, 6-dideoxy-N-acetyl-beta-L-altrosamine transaminase n=1 Tax=Thiomicrorhabdus lithotrophica TaxID=2949997 RepID=A0ABY8CEL4_9GAMM|nr:UDP-4-amino-4,6-dideoxy-N-acetyl-beta-L-altrosamine transaminase [Thiomicrorhabdus lithotrophica]WEJ63135.1 UDP-4-amino-4,6-dideoxy-N-acetyl-beta-L-altrosamine transaminase [Thiomicrorhabdus lithotrophica]
MTQNFIPYGKQDISEEDIDSVLKVLKSDFLTQGPQVPLFEKTVAGYCGAEYGVAVNSATSALHVACLALGLGEGDWLWTTPNTFVASANCGLYCGAKVDFVDIDMQSYNLSVEKLEEKLIQAKKSDKLPKIVIPVHFAGQSCNMKRIHSLSLEYGFKVIEDASHAIGGKYLDKPIGGCQYSDITVFSFHPVKIITTAEGGLATTNCQKLYKKMQRLRSHGITRDVEDMILPSEGEWSYQQIELGFNYRMTEIQAALGVSQMKRLDEFVARRQVLRKQYDQLLEQENLILPSQSDDCYSSMHLYPILLGTQDSSLARSRVFKCLRASNIGVNVHYIPVHTQPYYLNLGFKNGDFPNSELYYQNTVSLPLFYGLTDKDQVYVVSELKKALQAIE